MKNWNHNLKSESVIELFSQLIYQYEQSKAISMPWFESDEALFIFSDYGGDHGKSKYFTYSFLICDSTSVNMFSHLQQQFCKDNFLGNRIINFKGLNDKVKRESLIPFLKFSNSINGLLMSVIIPKEIQTIFNVDPNSGIVEELLIWRKKETKEKLLRIIHFAVLLLTGLSKPKQNLFWITDNDDIVANDLQLKKSIELFGRIASVYLTHDLGHFRFGRTKNADSEKNLERLCSLPDLVSGALCEMMTCYNINGVSPVQKLITPFPLEMRQKVLPITFWHSYQMEEAKLKKLVLLVNPSETGLYKTELLKFHILEDYLIDPF